VPALDLGVNGAILAIALFAGPTVRLMMSAYRDGRTDEALAIQTRLVPLAVDIGAALGPAGIKTAMSMAGLKGGPTRSPLQPVTPEERAIVAARLESAGVLPT
jgi:4-hydroxy-2-oxoglutarate aldolase